MGSVPGFDVRVLGHGVWVGNCDSGFKECLSGSPVKSIPTHAHPHPHKHAHPGAINVWRQALFIARSVMDMRRNALIVPGCACLCGCGCSCVGMDAEGCARECMVRAL